jgi:hypothetical protein
MARLGKRERLEKRAIIQGNLKATAERDYFNYRCPLNVDNLLGSTHTNAYGASGGWGRPGPAKRKGAKRWGDK